jgi:hypothetical protein
MMLMKYGPVYLDQGTYQATLGYRKRRYFVFLGTSLFRNRNKQFWAYHCHMMKVLGYPFSALMQLKVSLLAIVDKLLYPVKPILRTVRAFRKDKLSQAVAER